MNSKAGAADLPPRLLFWDDGVGAVVDEALAGEPPMVRGGME